MSTGNDEPRFRPLAREECESLLARNRVGRIAFARGNRVDVIPLHYVFADGVLCGRTARGTRLEKASENFSNAWPAAFEVDEVEELFDWRSVVVHGNLHAAVPGDAEWQRNKRDWEKAVRALRTLVPEAFSSDDPTSFRDVLIRLDVVEISGREATPPLRSLSPRAVSGRRRSGQGRRGPGKAAA
jgi:nitroimidazol reductase NimA-like FMN-containing flavoprotein (pyridoxamine 5'-phosphate oxidase superfamily)